MHLTKETKAISTLLLTVLILCSIVFGAFISYLWVMSNFYLEPENTVDLVITNVNFAVDHADYFYVTVMNPSHSPSKTNITRIYYTVEGSDTLYNVSETSPENLPVPLERATTKTIKCIKNWSESAGKTITVHVSALDAAGSTESFKTQFVKLQVETYFNATESSSYFNITVRSNAQSSINLTLDKVYLDYPIKEVQNTTLAPQTEIAKGQSITFRCFTSWQGYTEPRVRVETLQGYFGELQKEISSVVILSISNVTFNEAIPNRMNLTLFNSADSATLVDATDIVLKFVNNTQYHVNGTLANPTLPYRLGKNKTITFDCTWPWMNYRDKNVTITVFTQQGFMSIQKTVKTPPSIIAKITELNFNLTDTKHFLVNVTNMQSSLQTINVTRITINQNLTTTDPPSQNITAGAWGLFNCTFDWTGFRGSNVTITVITEIGFNISETLTLPSVDLKLSNAVFSKLPAGIPYVNITVANTAFSAKNVTITKITLKIENTSIIIDGTLANPTFAPNGYVLTVDANVTIICPWNWTFSLNKQVTITVQTTEGFSVSQTFQIPATPP